MVVLFALIPFVGYVIAGRIFREDDALLRATIGYALGLTLFVFAVNAGFHVLPLRIATIVALGALAVMGAGVVTLCAPAPAARREWSRAAVAVVIALAATAFIRALLWQLQHSDDDFFIHGPLMSLYLKDNFPPANPYFSELPYRGHYGRDLIIAALSSLIGERFLQTQYVVVSLNQAVLAVMFFGVLRKYGGGTLPAILGVGFAFFAVNGSRFGLVDTIQNNNSFAYLLLVLNAYLCLEVLTRPRFASAAATAASLGTYALVYETHFVILIAAVVLGGSTLAARAYGVTTIRALTLMATVVLASLLLAAVEGGAITDVVGRHLWHGERAGISEDLRGQSQEVSMRIPKPGLRVTSSDGTDYPLWDRRLLREGGMFIWALPFMLVVTMACRSAMGVMLGWMGVLAVAVPAVVDFGRFNSESLRFLFFAGMTAATLFGICLGFWVETWSHRGAGRKAMAIVAAAVIMVVACRPAVGRVYAEIRGAWRHPYDYFVDPGDWACSSERYGCEAIDVEAARFLRPHVRKGEALMSNLERGGSLVTLHANAVLSTFAGVYVRGAGIRISPDDRFSMTMYMEPIGFRARAFWTTLRMDILDDLKVDYLYVDPSRLDVDRMTGMRGNPRLMLMRRFQAHDEIREVYRVRREPLPTYVPAAVAIEHVRLPSALRPLDLYVVPVTLRVVDGQPDDRLPMFYRFVRNGKVMNAGDEVNQLVHLRRPTPDRREGEVLVIGPYDAGEYTFELFAGRTPGPHMAVARRVTIVAP